MRKTGHYGAKENIMENSGCAWSRSDDLLRRYHDTEWGVPVHDDRVLFEHLALEVMQCGLNWLLMLKKREIFRRCLAGFDPEKLARFTEKDMEAALTEPGMIRSRRKVEALVADARAFLAMQQEFGSFHSWLWSFTDGRMLIYESHAHAVPPSNELSDRISAQLKKRGFRYVGSITIYSMLQACGIINDHERTCPRFQEVIRGHPAVRLDS